MFKVTLNVLGVSGGTFLLVSPPPFFPVFLQSVSK